MHNHKKWIRLALTAALLCTLLATSAFAAKVTATANINVRKKANTSSRVLTVMKKGWTRTVIKTSKNGKWVKVKVNGKSGYVTKEYVKTASSSSNKKPAVSVSDLNIDLQTNYSGVPYRDKNGRPAGATIYSGGCCPTTVGNILRNLCGISQATTRNVCTLATQCGARYDGGTSVAPLLKAAKSKWGGFTYSYTTSDSEMIKHVKSGGMAFGVTCEGAASVVKAVRKAYSKTLIVKLSPNVTDIAAIARAVEAEGADSVSLINTLMGMSVDIERRRSRLSIGTGGLSGPCVKPVALRMVSQVARAVKIPVIGLGGIMNAEDALEFLMVGATAVEIGTANFIDPAVTIKVIEGMNDWLDRHGVKDVNEIIGVID